MISGSYDILILFLYFLTLAVFSDGKIRRLKSNPKKGGGHKTENQNLVGKRYLLQSRKRGQTNKIIKRGVLRKDSPAKGCNPGQSPSLKQKKPS